jgi:hypothetical protein
VDSKTRNSARFMLITTRDKKIEMEWVVKEILKTKNKVEKINGTILVTKNWLSRSLTRPYYFDTCNMGEVETKAEWPRIQRPKLPN